MIIISSGSGKFQVLIINLVRCVVGDLHGDLSKARWALNMAGVLSSDGRDIWTGGETVCPVLSCPYKRYFHGRWIILMS